MVSVSLMNSTTITMSFPRRSKAIFMASSSINTQLLRTQLHQLHIEAEKTRDKANNARLRLMRLSEAASNLQREAANNVRTGRENEARELLVQKRKVMRALEKSKSRIEILGELLAKLNEAISIKETQLIGNVSSGFELGQEDQEDSSTNIRIISPKEDNLDLSNEDQDSKPVDTQDDGDRESQFPVKCDANTPVNPQKDNIDGAILGMGIWDEAEVVNNLKDISSYEEFLEHIDKQISKIEVELVTFLRLSMLVLDSEEKPKNSKVQQAQEILEDVQGIRKRIASITKMKAKII